MLLTNHSEVQFTNNFLYDEKVGGINKFILDLFNELEKMKHLQQVYHLLL